MLIFVCVCGYKRVCGFEGRESWCRMWCGYGFCCLRLCLRVWYVGLSVYFGSETFGFVCGLKGRERSL